MRYKILPIFIPHQGCPHQCVFCDQKTITGSDSRVSVEEITSKIEVFATSQTDACGGDIRKEVAFYGGSFTALSHDMQRSLLEPACYALKKGYLNGIRLSTRPDYCDYKDIQLLKENMVETVELGVQSMDTEVLRLSGRGHTPEESIRAMNVLKSEGFITGMQLMPGLPGEDHISFNHTIRQAIKLKPDFVRLYPTVVIKGTKLEKLYADGSYKPLSMEDAVHLCSEGTRLLRDSGIRVIRCGLQPSPSLREKGSVCAGPFHPAFGELVESAIVFDLVNKGIKRLSASLGIKRHLFISSSPRLFSILKGQKGENLLRFGSIYPRLQIQLTPDPLLTDNFIRIKDGTGNHLDIKCRTFENETPLKS
ncbi:radical SAM protein [bacterium]|nr:radical SAM protein [bacterium]